MEGFIDRVVLDSNVVSYIFNRNPTAHYYRIRLQGARQFISFQTLEEAWYGAHSRGWGASRLQDLSSHLRRYEIIWPDVTTQPRQGSCLKRNGHRLKRPKNDRRKA